MIAKSKTKALPDVAKLTKAQAKVEHMRLALELEAHDRRYYQEDAPVVSDAEYDALRQRFNAIEKRFGVPGAVVVAIWGLETAYGAQKGGQMSIVRSLATLAYDCRRSAFFEKELLAALKIIDRGDMAASQLVGGWAGEIGQTQFLPDAYVKYAVDFDGNGRRDLIHSSADVLASTANFLKGHGWQRGAGWGPGTANYNVIREWNKAEVYVKTISVMADKLDGR